MRPIDADALEKEGWSLHRTARTDKHTWEYQTKPIANVLTIELEPHWIPCSERLPKDGTECLVSVKCSKKVVVVDMATYSTDLFGVDKEDFFGNRGESGWYYLSGEYGYCKMLNVIAWMLLPEPYREERRTDD